MGYREVRFLPQLLPPAEIGTAQQEFPVDLFAIEVFTADDPYDRRIHQNTLYPTLQSAKEAKALLEAEAIIREQEDWDSSPCECGKRGCDYRLHLFPSFSIQMLKLAS